MSFSVCASKPEFIRAKALEISAASVSRVTDGLGGFAGRDREESTNVKGQRQTKETALFLKVLVG